MSELIATDGQKTVVMGWRARKTAMTHEYMNELVNHPGYWHERTVAVQKARTQAFSKPR